MMDYDDDPVAYEINELDVNLDNLRRRVEDVEAFLGSSGFASNGLTKERSDV